MPKTLNIQNLTFSYPNSPIEILKNINLEFHTGWSAVIGANGSGKSTLLKIIAKELSANNCLIRGNELTYYCAQSTEKEPIEFVDFMTSYDSKAFKIRNSLNIKDEWLDSWKLLSHGQRKKAQLATALFMQPDILIVDEPTNHLDGNTKDLLYEVLKSFNGIGILVSHDRELIDKLCTNTIILKDAVAIALRGNYTTAMGEYLQNYEHLKKTQNQRDDEIKKLKKLIFFQQEKIQKSRQKLSKKGLDTHDSDAKEKINRAKLTGKDKSDGQLLQRFVVRHNSLEEKSVRLEKKYKLGISFETQSAKNVFPLFIQQNAMRIHQKLKLSFPNMQIYNNDKIGIIGENGCGKSSLVNYLMQNMNLAKGIFCIHQEITETQSKELLDKINHLPSTKKGEIFTIITRLSSNPKTLLESKIPSPGEARKLLIAQAILAKPNLIIMDEPTNHMDTNSITALEKALNEYNGALILVSHDKTFLKNTTSKTWSFEKLNEQTYEIKEF